MKIDKTRPVRVYRNLKHGRKSRPLYSVMQDGRVIRRTHQIMLKDAKFIVWEKSRQRVLKEGRKNVHAFVIGTVVDSAMGRTKAGRLNLKISYNPYLGDSFVIDGSNVKVEGAMAVILNQHGVTGAYFFEKR